MKNIVFVIYICLFLFISTYTYAIDPSDLDEVRGYYVYDISTIRKAYLSSDDEVFVKLINGMIFSCDNIDSYDIRNIELEDAAVFVTVHEYEGKDYYLYKLLISDEFYDAHKVDNL